MIVTIAALVVAVVAVTAMALQTRAWAEERSGRVEDVRLVRDLADKVDELAKRVGDLEADLDGNQKDDPAGS